jgi:hypothetical protein
MNVVGRGKKRGKEGAGGAVTFYSGQVRGTLWPLSKITRSAIMTTLETQDLEHLPDHSLPHGIQDYVEPLDMYFLLDFLSITQLEKIKQNGPIKIVLYINSAVDGKSHSRLSKRDDVCSEQGHFQHV